MTDISREEIYKRIALRDPYFDLLDVSVDKSEAAAKVRPSQQKGGEIGPIAAAEAGRHLAILGSIALSNSDLISGPNYFLAISASLKRNPDFTGEDCGDDPLDIHCSGELLNKRSGKARTRIEFNGSSIFDIDVGYKVLSGAMFEKIFSQHKIDLRASNRENELETKVYEREDPYKKKIDIEFAADKNKSSGVVRPVVAGYCKGHFPQYPAMPIAYLCDLLVSGSEKILCQNLDSDSPRFTVDSAEIEAHELVFAGAPLTIESELAERNGNSFNFKTKAINSSGKVALDMELSLSATT